ncbi:DEAD/DEAH box helicase [Minwuia sp.]|uniref:DEAD/DEAH box helicase n=1 Tax=Minwuia sp. TaxID=2493630 RepID=UPI003A8E539D
MTFRELGLSDEVCRAVEAAGYKTATPIQQKSIPHVLMGKDILGTAQTGTGKTAAFLLPMIDVMAQGVSKPRMPRALVLEPTRELAAQVADSFKIYAEHQKLSHALVIGGLGAREQEADLDGICDIIIATPGRLLDMFERGMMMLRGVQFLVIDEADRMMDMGFIPDVEKIVSLLPKSRQTLFFSATMPKPIRRLADKFLTDPKEAEVAPPASPAETVEQHRLLVKGDASAKRAALRKLIDAENVKNALIFCNRKTDVKMLLKSMLSHGYDAVALHGDMDQRDRMATLEKFKTNQVRFMVCSDVAARGIDIQGLSHVFNFDVPFNADDYVHRIGRTGRAGMQGKAFMLFTAREEKQLAAIHALIRKEIPEVDGMGVDMEESKAEARQEKQETSDEPPSDEKPKRARRPRKPKAETAETAETDDTTKPVEEKEAAQPAADSDEAPAEKKPTRRRAAAKKEAAPKEAASKDAAADDAEKPAKKPARKRASAKKADDAKEEPKQLPNGDGDTREARKPAANRSGGRQNKGDGTPQGLGDHVPAFLLKPLREKQA